MALLPHNPRDQRLLIVTLLAVGLGAVYQQLIWTPKNQELNALATRLDTLDSLNRVAKAEVAKGSGTKMKQEADELARELRMLRGIVPTENEVPQLLESVSTAARHAGLEISDVAPDGILKGEQYDTYKYKIGVTGPYHQVSRLLTNIGTLRRIVAPINVTLLPSSRSNAETKARKGDQLLEAKFGIQAYVAFTSVKHAATNAASATNTHIEAEHPGAQPSSIARELYAYTRDGRRDPFYSLLLTSELRPTMSDLRLTGVVYDPENRKSGATLRDVSAANTQYRVNVGSTLGRMRVSAIRNKTVVFAIEEFGTTRRDSLVLGDSARVRRP